VSRSGSKEREERRLVAESLFGSVLLRPAESEDQRWTDAVGAVGVKRSPQERAFALELFVVDISSP